MTAIVEIRGITKTFKKDFGQDLKVLDSIDLKLSRGEIVAILGTSGSGKSTLLRIIAGLIEPSAGEVICDGRKVTGPLPGVSMVFQNFALLPWLTVLGNVELGLEAMGVYPEERRIRALRAIDMVGMDGFESAYPRELSGGMCQRVGIARALVVDPQVLLLDEPFSALDILTSDNLRNDLLELWQKGRTHTEAMLWVTHNIEEAALLADRIIIFGNDPGCVRCDMPVNLPHPRADNQQTLQVLMDDIYQKISQVNHVEKPRGQRFKTIDLHFRLPRVEVDSMTGLMEALVSEEFKRDSELSTLSEELYLDLDDLMPVIECLDILRFAYLQHGKIALTDEGKLFAEADILQRKKIFATQLTSYVPLVGHILRVLRGRPGHTVSGQRFLIELQDDLSEDAAQDVLKAVIEWGRYAELYAYHDNTDTFSFENPQ
ncbi:MAG: nitrate/sulfonate/bicarbonate ABC transporter ATP-binding protein [Pseudomonadota bacterium]|nr:nitrate/sulfonate/bicarbonate ABC transporter ATP-binding protein [Pseudomonadota bacterium]MEC8977515.1 nitrate/sulfonate/bicarbonate ABC transporter ATP-binding protein [Pseudomonadota bacterium]